MPTAESDGRGHWYLAKSGPRKERLLISNLTRWDVQTFYPYIRRGGAENGKFEPLFPTYVFCRFDPTHPNWQAIRWAPGLSYFLHLGDELATLPDEVVGFLRLRTESWNEGAIRQRFGDGDAVTIVGGPFQGLNAIFKSYVRSRDRCHVLLQAVEGISSLEVPEYDLEAATVDWRTRFAGGTG
jgi:transcriptional antiterminator RfaH